MGADLHAILEALRERARLIVLCVVAALLLGACYLTYTPRVYRAEAILQVEQEERSLVVLDGVRAEDLRAQEVLMTLEQNLSSPGLLRAVIRHGNLAAAPAFLPEVPRPASPEALERGLAARLWAKVRPGSRLIDVAVEDHNPAMAARLTGAIIGEFIREGFQGRMETSQMAHDFMRAEAARLRARLEKSEAALQEYREQTRSVSLEDKQNLVVEKLKEMNTRVMEAKTTRLRLETDKALLAQMHGGSPAQMLAVASVARSAPVEELRRAIQAKETEIANLRKRYKPLHPKYIAAASELAELRQGLGEAIAKGVESVTQSWQTAVAMEKRLESALGDQEQTALALGKKAIAYNALSSEAQADKALYESILKRLKESDVTKNVVQNAVRVVSAPTVPDLPVKPHRKRTMLLALFGGVVFGCALALLQKSLDRSLRTVEEAEHLLGEIPALAAVPAVHRIRSLADGLPFLNDPGSAVAESFRTLRVSLSLLNGREESGRVILFTSAVPAEGKSFCAIHTAAAYARQGLSTLLIDADLRLPSVGGVFPVAGKPGPGLSDLLAGKGAPEETVRASGIEHLSLLCAGGRASRAAELLARGGMEKIVCWARGKYDRIIIDTAPVHAVSDTLLLVRHAETVCLVIRAGRTSAHEAAAAVRKLRKAEAGVDGFVLNGVRRYRAEDYAGYYRAVAEEERLEEGRKRSTASLPVKRIGAGTRGGQGE